MTGHVDVGDLVEISRIGAEELTVEWRIENVLSLPAGSDVWYLSPDFRIGNDRWRLRLNPNWETRCPASGCLMLGLVKYQGGPRQTFHVTVNIRGGDEKRREGEKEFWGHDEYFWNDFCSRYELVEHGNRLMPNGFLTITCALKRSGAYGGVSSFPCLSVEAAPTNGSQFLDKRGNEEEDNGKGLGRINARGIDKGNGEGLEAIRGEGIGYGVRGCLGSPGARGIGWCDNGGLGGLSAGGFDWVCARGCLEGLSAGVVFDDEEREKNNENNNAEGNEESKNKKNVKNTKKISLPARHENVISSLKTMLSSGRRADFTLMSGGREWPVHKAILEGRSGHFETLFLAERDEVRLDSDLVEGGALDAVLQFLYAREVGQVSVENVRGTYATAHQFLLGDLKAVCVQYMKDGMCPEMVCGALVLADTYGEGDLKERALECYFRESVNVIATAGWTELRENHPTIIAELFEELIRREGKNRRKE